MTKMKRRQIKPLPVCEVMCGSCPFRPGSPYAYLMDELSACSLENASRVCHSTGSSAINRRTGKPPRICRGTRDIQLQVFHRLGVIAAPTDEAWADAVAAINRKNK